MTTRIIRNLAAAFVAAMALIACNKENATQPVAAIMSDAAFDADNTASATIVLASSPKSDLTIHLAVSGTSEPGKTALPGSHLEFPASVIVSSGATSVSFTVTVKPEGLAADTYSAGIQIQPGSGYEVSQDGAITYIGLTVSGNGGGSTSTDLSLQANWTAIITGTELEYDDEGYAYIAATVTAPGSSYLHFDTYTDAELTDMEGGDIANVVSRIESALTDQVSAGSSVDEMLYQAGPVYIPYYEGGETYLYMLDFDTTGKSTGKYGKVRIVLPELEVEEPGGDADFSGITFTLSTTKTIAYAGAKTDATVSDQNELFEFFTVSGVGADQPYSIILTESGAIASDDDLREEVQGDYSFWEDLVKESASEYPGITVVDLMDAGNGTVNSFYSAYSGSYDAYLILYDAETAMPTGEYAKTTFTSQSKVAPAQRLRKVSVRK